MILIEPKVEIIPQSEGLEGIYRQIEIAGRTCYKSEDKITSDSAKDFVQKMINNGHTAMLEHGTVYLYLYETSETSPEDYKEVYDVIHRYKKNAFSKVREAGTGTLVGHKNYFYITTNFRVIIENNWLEDLKYISAPTDYHIKRITAKFTCDRAIANEAVRHRKFSFAQESTRYCNYSRDKFGNQLSFIIPSHMNLNPGEYNREINDSGFEITGDGYYFDSKDGFDDESLFIYHLLGCEHRYMALLDMGWKPQQARAILPNALKTELVMTGFIDDWKHFFELRCAKNAHPDMQVLANQLNNIFAYNKYI